jgi:4'-phosphopantetheinyl transferase EntD
VTAISQVARDISSVFPLEVGVHVADGAPQLDALLPEEVDCIQGASELRRRDFVRGRMCARRALQCCGIAPTAILPDADGVPRWPPGFVGSISHCDGLCAAAAGPRAVFDGIGIDVERITRLDAGARELICGFRELERLGSLSRSHEGLGKR